MPSSLSVNYGFSKISFPMVLAGLTSLMLFCVASSILVTPAYGQEAQTKEPKTKTESKVDKPKSSKKSSDDKKKDKEEKDKEEILPGLRQINLSGSYVDLVQPASFDPTQLLTGAGVSQKSFFKLIDFIDDLADDDEFDYVLFDLTAPFTMNSSQLDQLSRHMKKLSEAKTTYAWLENANNPSLCVAASCDKVFMADFGGIDMPSNSMQSMFYGDAFDLLGVQASVVRAGNFKGAVEPFVNPQMSKHLRQHYLDMLESLNDTLVDRIARGRGLKKSQVRELQKERVLLAEEALAAGIVDSLEPYGSMQKSIEDDIDEEINWVTPKSAKKKDMSFFQLMGEVMGGQSSSKKFKKNTIAIVHLTGAIVDGKKASPGSIVSGPTVTLIEKLAKEERIKGAVVRINSPGGSATASEAIRQALLKLVEAKPTVVSMGNVAASGGYWVSCIGTPVFAERGTITGSIGVFSLKVSAGALMRRIGIHMENITLDAAANAFAMDQPWSEEDSRRMQKMIDMVYDRFLSLVSDARGISVEDLADLAGGRVWSGAQALEHNLVDHIGGLDDCIAHVAKKAGLGEDYSIAHRPVSKSGLDISSLLGGGDNEEIYSNLPKTAIKWLQKSGIDLRQTRLILGDAIGNQGKPTAWALVPFEMSIK